MVAIINKKKLREIVQDNHRPVLVLDRGETLDVFSQTFDYAVEEDQMLANVKMRVYEHLERKILAYDNCPNIYLQAERSDIAFTVCGLLGREVSPLNISHGRGLTTVGELQRLDQPVLLITECEEKEALEDAKQYDNVFGIFTRPVDERKLLYVLSCYAEGFVPR